MKTGLTILALVAAAFISARTEADTITSTQLQSNFNGATGAGQTAAISASAFDFTGQMQLLDIQSISITLTIIDGDTGLGGNGIADTPYPPPGGNTQFGDDDFDVNSFSLQLDGINLAGNLLLNGFKNYDTNNPLASSDFVTLTLTGSPTPAQTTALLGALQDGTLLANVLDSTGDPNSNAFQIPNTLIDHSTPLFATLSITGTAVPEPSSVALIAGGLWALGRVRKRSRRKRSICA